jgi:hypothetical protein
MWPSRDVGGEIVMAEPSAQVRVRVVTVSVAAALQGAINSVLEEEQASGAQLIDIKLTATPAPPSDSEFGSGAGEYVAVILLRSGHARMTWQ